MNLLERVKGKRWAKWVGYTLFYNLAFLLFLNLTFPSDVLRERLVGEAAKAGYEIEIGDVGLAGLTGLRIENLALLQEAETAAAVAEAAPAEGGQGEGEALPPPPMRDRIEIDEVVVKTQIFPLIKGDRAFDIAVEAWDGELDGSIHMSDEGRTITARARGIDLSRTPLKKVSGLDLVGKLAKFELKIESAGDNLSKANGEISIEGSELMLQGGEVQNFELPAMALGTLKGKLPLRDGELKFDDFSLEGADLQAKLEGSMRFATTLKTSSINGRLRIKPSDDWWNRNEMLKTAANFALPAGSDGWRTIALSGQLARPGIRPVK